MVTPNAGDFQNAFATPDNGNFDAAMDAFYLTGRVTKDVGLSLRESEEADPEVRIRAWYEAARKRKVR